MSFLRYQVLTKWIRSDPVLVCAIDDILSSYTPHNVRSLLGLMRYYRMFVEGFAKITCPLHVLLLKDTGWHWKAEWNASLNTLKQVLTNPSPLIPHIVAFCDFKQPFRLCTDASTFRSGTILAKVQEGKKRIINCANRTVTKSKENCGTIRFGCFPVVYCRSYTPSDTTWLGLNSGLYQPSLPAMVKENSGRVSPITLIVLQATEMWT